MAEQAVSTMASAVIGGITDRALTTVMRKLRRGSRSGPAAAHEKLQRLETLVLKLRCAVEVSEKHAIESASLLEWRDRLRNAAAEGGAVVLDFQRRAREDGGDEAAATTANAPGHQQPPAAAAAAAEGGAVVLYFQRRAREEGGDEALATTANAPGHQQPPVATATEGGAVVLDLQRRAREDEGGDAASTSASAPGQQQRAGGALYFTRSALSGMAQRVRDGTRKLFSGDEDVQKLDSALEKMERLSPDISQFLLTLWLEVSPKLDQRPAKRRAPASISAEPTRKSLRNSGVHQKVRKAMRRGSEPRPRKAVAAPEIVRLASVAKAEAPLDPETEARMLARVLEPTLLCTERYYVKKTDDRDMEGLEWLAEWAAVLRVAVERGNAVLQNLCPGSDVIHKAGTGGGALEEDGEFYSFALAVEELARDESCFALLVDLCPRKHH